jgi:hypothetical protein
MRGCFAHRCGGFKMAKLSKTCEGFDFVSKPKDSGENNSGGRITHKKTGFKIWSNNISGKLDSDSHKWVSSLPQIIFNNDIEFINENHI